MSRACDVDPILMSGLIWGAFFIVVVAGGCWSSWIFWKRWSQVRFVHKILAGSRKSNDARVVASLSTLPDRIDNLEPTIRCLLEQTRPPDEIVIAVPHF